MPAMVILPAPAARSVPPQRASGLPPEHDRFAEPVRLVAAGRVELLAAGAGRAAEADAAARSGQQDADDGGLGQRADGRPRVVVGEDELVALAVLGVAVGAVGAHPDPVAKAVAVDDPVDGGGGSRRQRGEDRQPREARRYPRH
jgi:hypothetical protein